MDYFRSDAIAEDIWYPTIKATALRMNSLYSFYYVNLITPLFLGVIPLLSLLILNFAIYRKIKLPSELIRHHQHRMSKRKLRKEIDLARILVWIVTTFIVCHSVRLFLDIHEIAVIDQVRNCPPSQMFPPWILILLSISKLLIIVNSSVNMVIYCCLNEKFRRRFGIYRKSVFRNFSSRNSIHNDTEIRLHNNVNNNIEMRTTRSAKKAYI